MSSSGTATSWTAAAASRSATARQRQASNNVANVAGDACLTDVTAASCASRDGPGLSGRAHAAAARHRRGAVPDVVKAAAAHVVATRAATARLDLPAKVDGSFLFAGDIRLPGIDGLELLTRLKQRDASLPVVLITGHGDIGMAVGAMRDGAYDFMEKPFSPSNTSRHQPSMMLQFSPPCAAVFIPLVPLASSGRRGLLSQTSQPPTSMRPIWIS